LLLFCLLVPIRLLAGHSSYPNPDDPAVIQAARDAVKALGPGHGAIALTSAHRQILSKSVNLVGFSSTTGGAGLALKGEVHDVEKMLTDLGAKKTRLGYKLSLAGDVLFDFDKWDIKSRAKKILSQLAHALNKMGKRQVDIAGYTDSIGSDVYNLRLSKKRAEAVKTWLVEKGRVKACSFTVRGMGKSNPVAPNTYPDGTDNPGGRAKNRRVEIHIK
jgi:flagellar motor protein MotB